MEATSAVPGATQQLVTGCLLHPDHVSGASGSRSNHHKPPRHPRIIVAHEQIT